jgi:hypothetical protein
MIPTLSALQEKSFAFGAKKALLLCFRCQFFFHMTSIMMYESGLFVPVGLVDRKCPLASRYANAKNL